MSSTQDMKMQMQAVPAEFVADARPISMFSKFALLIGILNASLLGYFVYQTHQVVPAAVFVANNQRELHKILSLTSSLSDASVRLFHGSIPQLLNDLLTSDISGAASDTESWAESVHSATCTYSSNKQDYSDNVNFYISKYASLVHSVSNQIANIEDLVPSNDDMDDTTPQLTGKGGLTMEPLKYVTDFVKDQTDANQWKATACSCQNLAEQLKTGMPFTDIYGPDCDETSMSYNAQSKALQILNSVSTTCGSLCLNLASSEETMGVVA